MNIKGKRKIQKISTLKKIIELGNKYGIKLKLNENIIFHKSLFDGVKTFKYVYVIHLGMRKKFVIPLLDNNSNLTQLEHIFSNDNLKGCCICYEEDNKQINVCHLCHSNVCGNCFQLPNQCPVCIMIFHEMNYIFENF